MKAFFNTPYKIAVLKDCAASWLNTPFVPHGKVKGAGVDCVHLCAEIYRECGLWTGYEFPKYTMDGGHHIERSQIIRWIDASKQFVEVPAPAVGDVLCFKIGKTEHHAGILVAKDLFVHCWRKSGVTLSNLQDPTYRERLTKIYRPVFQEEAV